MMSPFEIGLLFTAAVLAGIINAVAGGGSFVSFPALLLTGVPAISANATNATALWPGSAASVGAYRRELGQQRAHLLMFGALSLAGGFLGALLLLRTQEELFEQLIPYLLLLATVVFAASPTINRFVRRAHTEAARRPAQRLVILALYLVVAVYGGFFGAGLGILTLAVLGLLGFENIHEMNALKTLQATLINGVAVATFVVAGVISWPEAIVMTIGAVIGGYSGAAIARRLNPARVRTGVVIFSVVLTIYFFLR